MKRFRSFRAHNWLLRLTSFVSNAYVAAVLMTTTLRGFQYATTRKITMDRFGPGITNRYEVLAAMNLSPSDIQNAWNYHIILQAVLGVLLAIPVMAALISHELWLRRINDAAQARGKALGTAYKPRLRRNLSKWASVWQWAVVIVLALATLGGSLLVTFGAWVVESINPKAGVSLPLGSLNESIYYGDLILKSDVKTSKDLAFDIWSELRDKGFIHVANPTISYSALYPEDKLDIPSEMRNTAYYLPRLSFPALESHLVTSARRKLKLDTGFGSGNLTNPGDIRLGDAVYNNIQTLGVGVNISSYANFKGDGMAGIPRYYEFGGMIGQVYGNAMGVQCIDLTEDYQSLSFKSKQGDISTTTYTFSRERSENMTQKPPYIFTVPSSSATGPLIFSHLALSHDEAVEIHPSGPGLTLPAGQMPNNVPMHTIFIVPFQNAPPYANQVLQCFYTPSEFAIHYGVLGDPGSPLKLTTQNNHYTGPPLPEPRCVNPIYALPAARAIHELLTTNSAGGKSAGGVLRDVLEEYYRKVDFPTSPYDPQLPRWLRRSAYTNQIILIEPVLTATAQAYFSLLRQRVEIANMWLPVEEGGEVPIEDILEKGLVKGMLFMILRVGGSTPYKLHFVGILVMAVVGAKFFVAAWRSLVFGRGEGVFGRWWERDLAGGEEGQKGVELEKGERVALLGELTDEKTARG